MPLCRPFQPPIDRWKQEHSNEVGRIVGIVTDELSILLREGVEQPQFTLGERPRGERIPRKLWQEMVATVRAQFPAHFDSHGRYVGVTDNTGRLSRREKNLTALGNKRTLLLAAIRRGITQELRRSYVANRGRAAHVEIERDYDWKKPIPGVDEFFRTLGGDVNGIKFEFNQAMPFKLCVKIALENSKLKVSFSYRFFDGRWYDAGDGK